MCQAKKMLSIDKNKKERHNTKLSAHYPKGGYNMTLDPRVKKKRREKLQEIGLSNKAIQRLADSTKGCFIIIEEIENRFEHLHALGFIKSVHLIEKFPIILSYDSESITRKIDHLVALGFTKPVVLIQKQPSILGFPSESITAKLDHLKELGFTKLAKLVENLPATMCYAEESITEKMNHLVALGFTKAVHLVEKCPSILAYAQESITGKIAHLEKLGFTKPVQLIEKFPTILSYAQNKMSLTARILVLVVEACSEAAFLELISMNIESLIIASLTATTRRELIKSLKTFKMSTKEKRVLIYQHMHTFDTELQRIYQQRYGTVEKFFAA